MMSGDCLCKNISHLLEDNLKLTRLNESVVCWMASIPAEWEKGGDIINLPPLSLQKMIEDMKSWIKEIPAELRNQLENEGVEDPEELEMSQQPEYDCIKLEDTHDEMEQKEDDETTPENNSTGKIRIPRISNFYFPPKEVKPQSCPNPLLADNSSDVMQNGRYPCNICEQTFSTNYRRKHHIKTKHMGERHLCDQCEYSTTRNAYLKAHKNAKHLGLRFPCDICEKTYENNSYLKRHIRKKHM